MLFHAFEIVTEFGYFAYANPDEQKAISMHFWFTSKCNEEVEAQGVGSVVAENVDEALSLIRKGKWEYTQS